MRRTNASVAGVAQKRRGITRWPPWALLVVCFVAFVPRLAAQSAKLAEDPPPPYDASEPAADAPPPSANPSPSVPGPGSPAGPIDTSAQPAKPPAANSISAAPAATAAPVFDPLHADRSMDVGTFYLKKGDYDAAIDRFQEAARLNPKLAKPYLLLGEVYEKKGDPTDAITAYNKYLELFQKAPDRDKVAKRIEKLQGKADRDVAHPGS
jgi:tetratricopeptide (TPR) repeat protein